MRDSLFDHSASGLSAFMINVVKNLIMSTKPLALYAEPMLVRHQVKAHGSLLTFVRRVGTVV